MNHLFDNSPSADDTAFAALANTWHAVVART
jgi:hypothetical protein